MCVQARAPSADSRQGERDPRSHRARRSLVCPDGKAVGMDIDFLCLDEGKALYAVREGGSRLFVGTRGECERFAEIHTRKVLEERAEGGRIQRHRPFVTRTYRVSRMHA